MFGVCVTRLDDNLQTTLLGGGLRNTEPPSRVRRAMFDQNNVGVGVRVAQTAAFGGLRLSSGPRTAADQPDKRLVRATGSICEGHLSLSLATLKRR